MGDVESSAGNGGGGGSWSGYSGQILIQTHLYNLRPEMLPLFSVLGDICYGRKDSFPGSAGFKKQVCQSTLCSAADHGAVEILRRKQGHHFPLLFWNRAY